MKNSVFGHETLSKSLAEHNIEIIHEITKEVLPGYDCAVLYNNVGMGILPLKGSMQAVCFGKVGTANKTVASEMRKLSEENGRIIDLIESQQ